MAPESSGWSAVLWMAPCRTTMPTAAQNAASSADPMPRACDANHSTFGSLPGCSQSLTEIPGLIHQSHRRRAIGVELGDAQRRQVEVQPIKNPWPGVKRLAQQ